MADGAAPHSKKNIAVGQTPFSGSAMYMAMKHAGTTLNDIIVTGLDFLEQQGKVADAMLAGNIRQAESAMHSLTNLGIAMTERSMPEGVGRDAVTNWVKFWHDFHVQNIRTSSAMMQVGAQQWRTIWGVSSSAESKSIISETFRIIRAFHKAHVDKLQNSDFLCSPQYAEFMWHLGKAQPEDTEVNAKLNDRFFTHNSTKSGSPDAGTLNEASAQQVQGYFKQGESKNWPNLILTSSHALVRDHKDVSDVMKGFHALITQAYGNGNHRAADLDLIRTLDGSGDQSAKDPSKPPRTIMLSSVYNDRNAMVNGGTLLLRMHYLAGVGKKYNDLNPPLNKRKEMEEAYLGNKLDGTHMSHASINLGKLILSLIVEDPKKLGVINAPNNLAHYENPWITPENPDTPIKLRADADDVLQHIKLVGYSKGGTIVTDALRFLILQLKHPANAKGDPSFVDHTGKAIDHTDITRMMTHMGVLCVNPGINPLSDREQKLGIRRMTIRNKNDIVTSHLFKKYGKDDATGDYDNVYVVDGTNEQLGHGIEGALGSRESAGYLMSKDAGDDKDGVRAEVKSRLQSFFASCYDKMGLSQVKLDVNGSDCTLNVELSTGVTFEQFLRSKDRPKAIQAVLEKAGFSDIKMQPDASQVSPYKGIITFTDSKHRDPDAIRNACGGALNSLNQQSDHNIFISQTSLKRLLKSPVNAVDTTDAAHRGGLGGRDPLAI